VKQFARFQLSHNGLEVGAVRSRSIPGTNEAKLSRRKGKPMAEPRNRECSTCEFWLGLEGLFNDAPIGLCTVHPPAYSPSKNEKYGTEVNCWPITTGIMS
jgi:hypothetical protein